MNDFRLLVHNHVSDHAGESLDAIQNRVQFHSTRNVSNAYSATNNPIIPTASTLGGDTMTQRKATTRLSEARSRQHILLRHQMQRVHQFHLRITAIPLSYAEGAGTLRFLSRHLAGDAKASKRLSISPSTLPYKSSRLHRGNTDGEEGTDHRSQGAASRRDQRAHHISVVDYLSSSPNTPTLNHTFSVCHVVHLS